MEVNLVIEDARAKLVEQTEDNAKIGKLKNLKKISL